MTRTGTGRLAAALAALLAARTAAGSSFSLFGGETSDGPEAGSSRYTLSVRLFPGEPPDLDAAVAAAATARSPRT